MAEIPKAYEPQSVEDKWYDFWLKQGCFTADPARVSDKRPAYSIVIPPPNVTGMLHMGHVLNNTIQDILSRKARMDGKEVLWLPGTDHAGIATEGMVSKQIWKEEKKSKRDIGREEFIRRVWQWKEKHGGIIIEQLKKLGCSCDWTRERFTMDLDYVRNVQRVFVDLYKKGLIYRGKRMVNWCPATQTALSDEEVEMKSQKGFMYHFRVEVVEKDAAILKAARPLTPALSPKGGEGDKSAPATRSLSHTRGEGQGEGAAQKGGSEIDSEGRVWLTIATTRPETIPADTAVAVNPKDPRYTHLIGKHVYRALPLDVPKEQRIIPIIADEYVDFDFGTGVLKVTPAHDKNDFDIGQRHKLPVIDVLTPDAKMTAEAGADLVGLDRFVARKKAAEILEAAGALDKAEPYENTVGFSQRADVPIEPRLSEQWFLKYPAVPESKACVAEGRMKFHPERWAKTYDHWLANIQDWCISRQLWWGHRIPVWRMTSRCAGDIREKAVQLLKKAEVEHKDLIKIDWEAVDESYVDPQTGSKSVARTVAVCISPELSRLSSELEALFFVQDPDVLDTWFSSWLWPFATMGWPEQTETLKKFYPTTDLVTGPDIIFFWVARMIMAGYEFMGEAGSALPKKFALPDAMPFKNVYFTGIIRDKQGRKMSKSLGNSPDPLVLIAQYGADALRFGTMRSAPLGQDVLFDEKDVELGRNFCNKLWNACRFRQMQGGEVQSEINPSLLTSDDKWILLKLHEAIREISEALNTYNFSTAAQALYRFFWSEYCDWYVEASKAVLTRPATESSPSPLNGERAGVRGEDKNDASHKAEASPHPDPLPPARRGGEGTAAATSASSDDRLAARRANTIAVIDFVLSHTLRLFHPFLPFITEELWHGMGYATDMPEGQGGKTIMNAPWPKPFDLEFRDAYSLDECYLEFANQKYEVVTQGRNLRRVGNIQSGKKVRYVLKPSREVLPHDAEVIKILLNAEALEMNESYAAKKGTPTAHTPFGELFLPLEGLVDVEAEKARLTKEKEKIEAEIVKVKQKLANPAFTQKVPASVLQEHEQRLLDWQAKLEHVKAALEALG